MGKTILTPLQKNILNLLAKDKFFTNSFYFTGGTVLTHYYLQHRLSEDLDFFSEEEIDELWLASLAKKISDLPNMLVSLPDDWRDYFEVKAMELKKEVAEG